MRTPTLPLEAKRSSFSRMERHLRRKVKRDKHTPDSGAFPIMRRFHSFLSILLILVSLGQGPLLGGCCAFLSASHSPTVSSGMHCPITYASTPQDAPPSHDCSRHQSRTQRQDEWRCNCGHHPSGSVPDTASLRFLLPHPEASLVLPTALFRGAVVIVQSPILFLSPPDPPPRSSSVSLF
jgi:hypothetical protein